MSALMALWPGPRPPLLAWGLDFGWTGICANDGMAWVGIMGQATNTTRAELAAFILALHIPRPLRVCTDSQNLIRGYKRLCQHMAR
eukprot:10391073-Alexandrium_andersonii.AAC.1